MNVPLRQARCRTCRKRCTVRTQTSEWLDPCPPHLTSSPTPVSYLLLQFPSHAHAPFAPRKSTVPDRPSGLSLCPVITSSSWPRTFALSSQHPPRFSSREAPPQPDPQSTFEQTIKESEYTPKRFGESSGIALSDTLALAASATPSQPSPSYSKQDPEPPPPPYSEALSPLHSFVFSMATAGGSSSIITQVQQAGPQLNTLVVGGTYAQRVDVYAGELQSD